MATASELDKPSTKLEPSAEPHQPSAKRPKLPPPLSVAIKYTRQHPDRKRCGAVAGKDGLSLLPCTFIEQHGRIPCDFDPGELGNEMIPVSCDVRDARVLDPQPTLGTHGYQLSKCALTPLKPEDANAAGAALELHYREVAAAIKELLGASEAVSYCHCRRSATAEVQQSSAGGPFAGYAHTDQAADSWSGLLPKIVDDWAEQGPPHIPAAFAQRCAAARRYAVVTAWRYLGPAEACRSSHLAVLDPHSVATDDVLPFDIAAFGNVGRNYRLRHTDDAAQRHAWWYWSGLLPSRELVLLTIYDSSHPVAVGAEGSAPFAGLPVTSIFHSAFSDPSASPEEPQRESIDTRVILLWD